MSEGSAVTQGHELNSLAVATRPAGAVSCTSLSILFWQRDFAHPIFIFCAMSRPRRLTWLYLYSHAYTRTKLPFHIRVRPAELTARGMFSLTSQQLRPGGCCWARRHHCWPSGSPKGNICASWLVSWFERGYVFAKQLAHLNLTTSWQAAAGMSALPGFLVCAWWHEIISQLTCC